ncbi:hypothetical protein [Planomicrobium sp. YIM 101495]|uniref:hypothetical protein n=1 Tax=Planomicrobium sp. YIM 101495 TaxID=2665160 RepID=UPI0012B9258B|nr:hypothetical protein [Planomicrobium sp. YIM 101495]MTD30179.1 hypothetical protein [Planomicrobium sp. YIM 101495]
MTQLQEIQKCISKRPYHNTVTLPVSLVEALLDYKNALDRAKEEKRMLQSQVNYYKTVYPATIKEARTLRKEVNRLRKEAELHGY